MDDADAELPFEVRASAVHGLGAFATRPLRRGQRVGVYTGRRFDPGAVAAEDWDNALTYLFALSDGRMIDGRDGGNGTRHLNHSCAPNCAAYETTDDDGELQIVIEARRRIRAGDELFIDYALDIGDDDPAAYACRCGAAGCRGTMAGVPGVPSVPGVPGVPSVPGAAGVAGVESGPGGISEPVRGASEASEASEASNASPPSEASLASKRSKASEASDASGRSEATKASR